MIDRNSIYFQQAALLFRVLPVIATEKCFALKGGSAINMFIRDLPRLSVDADLTFMPLLTRNESLQCISESLGKIHFNIKSKIQGSTIIAHSLGKEPYIIKLSITFRGVNVIVEVAPVLRGTVFTPEQKNTSRLAEENFGFVNMPISSIPDLYGGKICAALDRQHPRDLFDIMILFENEGITNDIRKAFIIYLVSHNRPLHELLAPQRLEMQSIFEREFQGMTMRICSWKELYEIREQLISSINLQLTQSERLFLISFKEGNPEWDLLQLPNIENIKQLPAIQWKLQNIHKMNSRKHKLMLEKLKVVLFGKW